MTKSPFPGMDPYLEPHWRDIHATVVPYLRDALNASLPDDLVSRIEERVAIEVDDGESTARRGKHPDVRVFEHASTGAFVESADRDGESQDVALLAPVVLSMNEPATELYVKILDPETERLVTVIELLSETNKTAGLGLDEYVAKRTEMLSGGVNLVELDLVRRGDWQRLLAPMRVGSVLQTTYRYTYRRGEDATRVGLHPITLGERLPPVRVPLRKGDPVLTVELQPLVDRAYQNGKYYRTLNYTVDCSPPLQGAERAVADELLRAAGKR